MIYKREEGADAPLSGENSGNHGLTYMEQTICSSGLPTAALNIGSCDSGYVSDWLYENYGIAVEAGAHCAPLMHEALGTREQGSREVQLFPCTDGKKKSGLPRRLCGVCRRRNAAVREAAAGIRDTKKLEKEETI